MGRNNITYIDDWKKGRDDISRYKLPKGFESVEDFLGYCATHKGDFDVAHANLLYKMAGHPPLEDKRKKQVVAMPENEINKLLKIIGERLNPREN